MRKPTPDDLARAVDQRTLLPGEDPSSDYLDDALHWILVYSELLRFKALMLDTADSAANGLTDAARQDIGVDRQLLSAQAERYALRRKFWSERAAILSNGHSTDATPAIVRVRQ